MLLRDSMKYDALVKCFESDLRNLKKPWLWILPLSYDWERLSQYAGTFIQMARWHYGCWYGRSSNLDAWNSKNIPEMWNNYLEIFFKKFTKAIHNYFALPVSKCKSELIVSIVKLK